MVWNMEMRSLSVWSDDPLCRHGREYEGRQNLDTDRITVHTIPLYKSLHLLLTSPQACEICYGMRNYRTNMEYGVMVHNMDIVWSMEREASMDRKYFTVCLHTLYVRIALLSTLKNIVETRVNKKNSLNKPCSPPESILELPNSLTSK